MEQTRRDFEVVVIDNSGQRLARRRLDTEKIGRSRLHIIENESNRGFGAAVNQACSDSSSPFLATLNDDAVADARWLEELLLAMESGPKVGMCASQVRMLGRDKPAVLVRLFVQPSHNTILAQPLAALTAKHHLRLGL